MKKIFVALACVLSGCASIGYHPPIEMPQDEVASLHTVNRNGQRSEIGAQQITDCYYRDLGFSQNCSQIICKKDESKSTGLNCLMYHPTDIPVKEAGKN